MHEHIIPINPIGKENIGAPAIGKIQSKAVIIPIAIDTLPSSLSFFSIKFLTLQNYQFFASYY